MSNKELIDKLFLNELRDHLSNVSGLKEKETLLFRWVHEKKIGLKEFRVLCREINRELELETKLKGV